MLIAQPETIQEVLVSAVRALGLRMDYHSARFEAELLLANAIGISRAVLLARLGDPLDREIAAQFAGMVARRAQGEPVAYILGHVEFFGIDLIVDRRVLIPRAETELLVELGLKALKSVIHPSPVVVDIGTGSGAIALSLAHNAPAATVIATDISPDALAIARLNAKRLGLLDRIIFIESDLLDAIEQPIDILIANLPYIPIERYHLLPREIRNYEPRIALVGGLDGLGVLRRLLRQLDTHVARAGFVFLEISGEQGRAAVDLVQTLFPAKPVHLHKDLGGLDRVIELRMSGE